MRKQQIEVLTAVRNYLGNEGKRRGTIVMNSYGQDCTPYTGLISLTHQGQVIKIEKEHETDLGITLPLSKDNGNGANILYLNRLYDEENTLVYQNEQEKILAYKK